MVATPTPAASASCRARRRVACEVPADLLDYLVEQIGSGVDVADHIQPLIVCNGNGGHQLNANVKVVAQEPKGYRSGKGRGESASRRSAG